jgi:hypothetical protein
MIRMAKIHENFRKTRLKNKSMLKFFFFLNKFLKEYLKLVAGAMRR